MYVNHFQNFKKKIARGITKMSQKPETDFFLKNDYNRSKDWD